MTDKEMLEYAAKAAGVELVWHGDTDPWCYAEIAPGIKWNPLTDDGDALRLAVKLRHELGTDVAQCFGIGRFDEYKNGPLAATRRAIVRAAAEIGRKL